MKKGIVVAGIGTDVGKTVASAIIVEALKADYWKPIQAGELNYTDTDKIRDLISNSKSEFHKEAFRLSQPMSPHAAAYIDDIELDVEAIEIPHSENTIIIELAGGIHVPINKTATNLDLIQKWRLPVVLVVNFYLGSINHTLLSIEVLKNAGCSIAGLIFNGEENFESKKVILSITKCKDLGAIPKAELLDKKFIRETGTNLSLS